MADETEREIFRALRDGQTRYTYFLLTAAAAGIALAINQTHGTGLSWLQIPLGMAVLSWALSFSCGCRHLDYIHTGLYANAGLVQLQTGAHPEAVSYTPPMVEAAIEGTRRAMEASANKAVKFSNAQFYFLISGGIFYFGWHVLEMYRHWSG